MQFVGPHVLARSVRCRAPTSPRSPSRPGTRRAPCGCCGGCRGPRVVEPRIVVRYSAAVPWRMTVMSGSPSGFAMPCATSMRNPSTPRSSQNRSVFSRSSTTSGLSQFRSGCSASKMCRYHWPGLPSASMIRVHAGPPKMLGQLFGGCAPSSPATVAEDVALALVAAGAGGQGGLKPRVRRTGVVGHQVHRHLDPAACAASDQPVHGAMPPNSGSMSRGSERRNRYRPSATHDRVQPDRVDAEQLRDIPACAARRRGRRHRHRCCRRTSVDRPDRRRRGTTRVPSSDGRFQLRKGGHRPETYTVADDSADRIRGIPSRCTQRLSNAYACRAATSLPWSRRAIPRIRLFCSFMDSRVRPNLSRRHPRPGREGPRDRTRTCPVTDNPMSFPHRRSRRSATRSPNCSSDTRLGGGTSTCTITGRRLAFRSP